MRRTDDDEHAWGTPSIAAGIVYCGCSDEYLYAVDLSTGATVARWRTQTSIWNSPALASGMLFAGGGEGCLYAIG